MPKWTAALLLLATPLWADEIILKNGSSLKGVIVRQTQTSITLEMTVGTIDIERHQIDKIVEDNLTIVQEFKDRYRKIESSTNPADFWKLADWCRRNGATNEVRALVEHAIRLEPSYDQMDRAHFVIRLVKSGISTTSVKNWIELHLIDLKVEERDRDALIQDGMSRELAAWLIDRIASTSTRGSAQATRPQAPKVAELPPAPAPEPSKRVEGPVLVQPKPFCDDAWQRAGFPEAPYRYPIVTNKNPWPYVPNYYGQYIYYVPYGNYPVITTPPSTGSYR